MMEIKRPYDPEEQRRGERRMNAIILLIVFVWMFAVVGTILSVQPGDSNSSCTYSGSEGRMLC